MLPQLNADPNNQVDVQQTAFSYDVLGRWVCGSWPEVSGNGGDPFDVVVIGAGMFGGYIADKLYRRGGNECAAQQSCGEGCQLFHIVSTTCSTAYITPVPVNAPVSAPIHR